MCLALQAQSSKKGILEYLNTAKMLKNNLEWFGREEDVAAIGTLEQRAKVMKAAAGGQYVKGEEN